MHAYGLATRVRIDGLWFIGPTNKPSAVLTVEQAETLLKQLPVAIREAELQVIEQLSLVFPGEDAA